MQVTETNAEGLKREFKVVVSREDIEGKVTTRLTELKGQVSLPGFRPGKVPPALLRKKYGMSLLGEVLEQVVQEATQNLVTERALRPAMQPKIEVTSFKEGADLEFNMALEVIPEITPMDFATLQLERLKVDMAEEEIDKTLERMAKQQGTPQPVTEPRPTKSGDVLVIDFLGRVGGVEFAGGKAEDYHLELGSGAFIPGFEDQLIGLEVGAKTVVKVKFPDAYGNKELAGQDAEFDVTIKELREILPSAVDDELAKTMGMDDLAALKTSIRDTYSREYEQICRTKLKRVLLDELSKHHDFEVPEGMVEHEFASIWEAVQQEREKKKAAGEAEAEGGKTEDELKAEYRDIAKRRVRLGLLLSEVGRANNLTVNQEDVNRALMGEARRFPGQEQRVVEYYRSHPEALESLRAPIYEEKVVDFIIEMAKITDKLVKPEELLSVVEADDDI